MPGSPRSRLLSLRAAALAAALAVSSASTLACSRGHAAPPPPSAAAPGPSAPAPAATRLVVPQPVRHAAQVTVTGTLTARQSAPLGPSVGGTLLRVAVLRGQEVKQGALLLSLDDGVAQASLRQADAGVAAATAQLALAEDGLARVERLRREEGASEAQLIQVRSGRELARAQLAAAEAQRDLARVNLSHHHLSAPFAGVVTRIPDGVGVTVGPGTPLVAMATTRQLVLQTSVTQEEAAELRPGARATVSVQATGARTTDATVTVVVPAVDPGTNRVPIEIEVPNADGRFMANAFARAELPRGAPRDAWRVPAAALVQRAGSYALWTAGSDGKAQAVPVRLLAEDGTFAVVQTEGGTWPAGLRVVEAPPVGLVEGTPVAEVRG
jgi:RND family efflux transporter MFP subunit